MFITRLLRLISNNGFTNVHLIDSIVNNIEASLIKIEEQSVVSPY